MRRAYQQVQQQVQQQEVQQQQPQPQQHYHQERAYRHPTPGPILPHVPLPPSMLMPPPSPSHSRFISPSHTQTLIPPPSPSHMIPHSSDVAQRLSAIAPPSPARSFVLPPPSPSHSHHRYASPSTSVPPSPSASYNCTPFSQGTPQQVANSSQFFRAESARQSPVHWQAGGQANGQANGQTSRQAYGVVYGQQAPSSHFPGTFHAQQKQQQQQQQPGGGLPGGAQAAALAAVRGATSPSPFPQSAAIHASAYSPQFGPQSTPGTPVRSYSSTYHRPGGIASVQQAAATGAGAAGAGGMAVRAFPGAGGSERGVGGMGRVGGYYDHLPPSLPFQPFHPGMQKGEAAYLTSLHHPPSSYSSLSHPHWLASMPSPQHPSLAFMSSPARSIGRASSRG